MKNGKSFTELLKPLITEHTNKGDPKSILNFLDANQPPSDQAANPILSATEQGRKNATARDSASFT